MAPQPWFRFYSETLSDRKIERLCRVTGQPKVLIVGAWATLLALANDSPVRGALLLTEKIPLTRQDLAIEFGLDEETTVILLDHFTDLSMLTLEEGVFCLTNWCKRQFASDSSTERVRQWREKQREPEDGNVQDVPDETLQKRSGNAPDTDTDTDTDTELHEDTDNTRVAKKPATRLSVGQADVLELFGAKRYKTKVQAETILELEREFGTKRVLDLARWASLNGMNVSRAVAAIKGRLDKERRSAEKVAREAEYSKERRKAVAAKRDPELEAFHATLKGVSVKEEYSAWYSGLELEEANGVVHVVAPNERVLEWIENRSRPKIEGVLAGIFDPLLSVEFMMEASGE